VGNAPEKLNLKPVELQPAPGGTRDSAVVEAVQAPAPELPTQATERAATPFEEKYAGASRETLIASLAVVREKRLTLQKKILSEREAAGLFMKVPVQPGQHYDFSKLAQPEVDRKYPRQQTRLAHRVRGGNNSSFVEVSAIPPKEYPEFDQIQDEEMWLHGTLDGPANH